MPASAVTPVTVLTGFLGSGKTTLLNAMLRDPRYADTAVLVNEWGEIAIDHALVRSSSENVVTLPSGCICCRVAGELLGTLRELHFQRAAGTLPAFRRVVIETTGLADPAPLLATLIEMPAVAARYSLAGVVATVDAEHGMATLDAHPEAVKQAAIADRIVITKVDRAGAAGIDALEERLRALNPGARIVRKGLDDVPDPALLLDTGLYRAEGRIADPRGWLNAGAYRRAGGPTAPRHDPRITSFAWTSEEPFEAEDLETALETLVGLLGARILRLKGLVNVRGEPGPVAVHAVQHTLYPPARLPEWPDADRRTRLVFIGRDLEESAIAPILQSFRNPPPR
ncbi:MAG TPA: GTP-binding protein [Usitatibacter sp.]|nr:GTP-binding protein [Usitatibacter sp.]